MMDKGERTRDAAESTVRVAWHKLRRASPAEILYRTRRAAATAWQRRRFLRGSTSVSELEWTRRLLRDRTPASEPREAAELWRAGVECDDSSMWSAAEIDQLARRHASAFAGRLDDIRTRAQRVAQRRFSFLGANFETAEKIPWQRDPRTGYAWPRRFFADIDLHPVPDDIDVRLTWELNRQQFLFDCAAAHLLTAAPEYAADASLIIDSWIDDNPYLEGVNWTSALEAAMRVLSWLWTYAICRRSSSWTAARQYRLAKSLYEHGDYIERHLSFYSSPYNHLVGEALALFALGSFLPQLARAAQWRERGRTILCGQVTHQFHADGASVEQSTSYHSFTLGFYLMLIALSRRSRTPLPLAVSDRVERGLEWAMWMTRPDGRTPAIGDADDARSLPFSRAAPFDLRSTLAIGAALYRRGDMKWVAGEPADAVLWMLGPQEFDAYTELEAYRPNSTVRTFAESGYAVMRSGWDANASYLCFDAGPIAAGLEHPTIPSSAHGHADLLSFEACVAGVPAIVDPGCFTYGGDPAWHRYFRETQAHNTARIDGRSQARYRGRFKWSHAARPRALRTSEIDGGAWIDSEHSGFDGLADSVRHRRAVLWRGAHWYVFDCFEGDGRHQVEVFFHLAPCQCQRNGLAVLASFPSDTHLHLMSAPGPLQLEVVDHGVGPAGGWLAQSYGVACRAPVLRFHGEARLPLHLAFAAVLSRDRPPTGGLASFGASADGLGYSLRTAEIDEDIEVRWDSPSPRLALRRRREPA